MKTTFTLRSFLAGWCLLCAVSVIFAQEDLKPWERLGLSITEWKLIQDNNMPMEKVEELLKAGIGISEYFTHPWEECNLTEEKWIAMRRSGLTSDEIKLRQQVSDRDFIKNQKPAENSFEEYDASGERHELFTSFLAPGWLQVHDERKTKGRVMIGLAAGSIAGTVGLSIYKKQFISIPLIAVLVPDMVWSMVNQKNHAGKEQAH